MHERLEDGAEALSHDHQGFEIVAPPKRLTTTLLPAAACLVGAAPLVTILGGATLLWLLLNMGTVVAVQVWASRRVGLAMLTRRRIGRRGWPWGVAVAAHGYAGRATSAAISSPCIPSTS